MKKKLLATAIASAMVMPSAFAAQDTSGMQFTSASEGFYASIRVRYNSGGGSNGNNEGADIQNSSSRFGVQGTNDLGGGLEGFYRYEAGVGTNNGDDLSTRMAHVGLRGAFGQLWVGSNWAQTYNWVGGTTDIANVHSGNLNYTTLNPGRQSTAIEYTTPDLNGFQGSALVSMDNNGTATDKDETDLDLYILAARYAVAGFDAAVSYAVAPEGIRAEQKAGGATVAEAAQSRVRALSADPFPIDSFANAEIIDTSTAVDNDEDFSGYSVKLGYAQDNWYVNTWYHEDNASDVRVSGVVDAAGDTINFGATNVDNNDDDIITYTGSGTDREIFSIAGGVEVGKVNLYAVYETREMGAKGTAIEAIGNTVVARVNTVYEDNFATFGVQYNLGANSRVWIEYANRDLESKPEAEDYVTIGMRHDF